MITDSEIKELFNTLLHRDPSIEEYKVHKNDTFFNKRNEFVNCVEFQQNRIPAQKVAILLVGPLYRDYLKSLVIRETHQTWIKSQQSNMQISLSTTNQDLSRCIQLAFDYGNTYDCFVSLSSNIIFTKPFYFTKCLPNVVPLRY